MKTYRSDGGWVRFTIVTGNPVDGITLTGVFDTADEANEFADAWNRHEEWWIAEIEQHGASA